MDTEDIFLIGPNPEENDLPISTISRFCDIFTFVVRNRETGAIKPLVVGNTIPQFSSEKKAVEWILK